MQKQPLHVKSIGQYHQAMGLSMPDHPHFSVIEFDNIKHPQMDGPMNLIYDFYLIFFKKDSEGRFSYRYGHRTVQNVTAKEDLETDFDSSKLFFMSSGQVLASRRKIPKRLLLPAG